MDCTAGVLCNLDKDKLRFQRDKSRLALLWNLSLNLKHSFRQIRTKENKFLYKINVSLFLILASY